MTTTQHSFQFNLNKLLFSFFLFVCCESFCLGTTIWELVFSSNLHYVHVVLFIPFFLGIRFIWYIKVCMTIWLIANHYPFFFVSVTRIQFFRNLLYFLFFHIQFKFPKSKSYEQKYDWWTWDIKKSSHRASRYAITCSWISFVFYGRNRTSCSRLVFSSNVVHIFCVIVKRKESFLFFSFFFSFERTATLILGCQHAVVCFFLFTKECKTLWQHLNLLRHYEKKCMLGALQYMEKKKSLRQLAAYKKEEVTEYYHISALWQQITCEWILGHFT